MFLPKTNLNPLEYDVNYNYAIVGDNKKTVLSFEIGNFFHFRTQKTILTQQKMGSNCKTKNKATIGRLILFK